MARIPEDEVERLKKEISVERLAEARGIKLKRLGADLHGLCPFHDDKTPSLVITPAKNLWHCMGACNAGGTAIDWVMRAEGISFRHAVELLRLDHLPLSASPGLAESRPLKVGTVRKLPPPVAREADDRLLLTQVVGYYTETLKQSPEAMKYLASRGLTSPEIIDRFRLGFANRTLGLRLPAKNRAAGAEMRGRLQALGVLRESGHEHFNGSLVVPVVTPAGEVVEMYGRKITANLREGTPDHLYLKGEHRGVWNEEALIASKEVILCESLIDALTFWAAGFRNVTASYGVNGFTKDHRAAFERHGVERVYLAYDRDEAGDKAAAALAEELMGQGLECFRVEFPKGMDANEYALKVTPAAKSLGVLLNRASWLGKGQRPERVVVPHFAVAAEIVATPSEERAAKERMVEEEVPEPTSMVTAATEPEDHVLPLAAVLPPAAPVVEVRGEDIFLTQGDRRYRIRGLGKNLSHELLKVNILVTGTNARGEPGFHVDTLDLYSARQRGLFTRQASEELGVKEEVFQRDLGQVLFRLEGMQEERIRKALEPKETAVTLTEDDRAAALELLRDPRLKERILEDFARCGVVGEERNKLVGYFAAVSRHLAEPLAVIVQSSSAAGKSSLMEAVLAFMPEEQRVQFSAMTGQSLFYMGEQDLKHKILAIAEEEGAHSASYALKLLQSEHKLSIASTGKDPATGRLVTHEYRVEGPVMIFLTTTALDLDEELLNRCLVLTVDEERGQTRAIHRLQREAQTLGGLLRKRERNAVLTLHRNAQRLLKPLTVVNELAPELGFPDSLTRTRRDHMKFLTLIRAVTLLHQYQRPLKTTEHLGRPVEYIETEASDIELAKELIHEVLGRSTDELRPQTRRLLLLVDEMVAAECKRRKMERAEFRFSRRDVRAATGWGDSQLKKHLSRLEDLEYLIVHRGGRGQSFVYELFFTQPDGQPDGAAGRWLPGLFAYDGEKSRLEGDKSRSSHGPDTGVSPGGHAPRSPMSIGPTASFHGNIPESTVEEPGEEIPVVPIPSYKPNGAFHAAAEPVEAVAR